MNNLYFAMHCQTARNIDDNGMDNYLSKYTDYDPKNTPKGEEPSKQDLVTGQVDLPLIYKGRKQAELIALQLMKKDPQKKVNKIICANQKRCKETALIVKDILEKNGYSINLILDKRLNARGYGILADECLDIYELYHFYKAKGSLKRKLKITKCALTFISMPKRLNAESKKDYKSRVVEAFNQYSSNLDNSLIVGGSDIYRFLEKRGSVLNYRDEELHRGELASVEEFSLSKKQKERGMQR